jgi:cell division protein FtsI (penicillin-binding protein 3)
MGVKDYFLNNDEIFLSKNRLVIVFCFIIIVYFILIGRIVFLTTFQKKKEYTQEIITDFNISNKNVDTKRVNILDRTGTIIATDIPLFHFYLNKDLVVNPKDVTAKIVKIFPDLDLQRTFNKIVKTKSKFVLIHRNITESQQEEIKKAEIVGFEFINNLARIYPHKNLFSHVLGWVNSDKQGASGIELQYDNYLNNSNNKPLVLTLDSRIQSVVRQQLIKGMERYKSTSMVAIVSEIKTGNIIAMVNLPDFDPNKISEAKKEELFNSATFGVYEMGSILKVLTVALALDKNIITQNDKFDVSKVINYGKYQVKQEYFSKQFLNAEEILEKSSNVGAGLIGLKIGGEKMRDFFNNIGFLTKVPTNFPSLQTPILPPNWNDGHTLTISYGYGIAVTPLHIIMGISAISNDGILKVPRFVRGEEFIDKKIISSDTSKTMNLYLRNVVRNGTGQRANTLGYVVGGKTGSSRILNKKKEYEEGKIRANFIGIFPMNNPTYSIFIMVENPKLQNKDIEVAAGNIAAPLFSRIIESIAPILNVVPYINKNEI